MKTVRIPRFLIVVPYAFVLWPLSVGGQSSPESVAASATQVGPTVTQKERDAIADTVRRATTDFFAAIQTVDADKAGTFNSRSSDFTFAGDDGSICRTSEVCQKLMKEAFDGLRSQQIRILDWKIAVPASTVAVETMSAAGGSVTKDGKTVVIDKSAITLVWVREPEGWKLLTLHQSFLPPKTQ